MYKLYTILMEQDPEYIFDPNKNRKLKEERGVNFEDVIMAIEKGQILGIRQKHHNSEKYPDQKILIIEIDDYAYQIPFVQDGQSIVLKTVYPSRKATAFYLKKESGEQNE